MPETPKTREGLGDLIFWNTGPGMLRAEVDNVLFALSAAGLAVVPREAPQVAIDTASQIFGSIQAMYRETVAAADLLTKERESRDQPY